MGARRSLVISCRKPGRSFIVSWNLSALAMCSTLTQIHWLSMLPGIIIFSVWTVKNCLTVSARKASTPERKSTAPEASYLTQSQLSRDCREAQLKWERELGLVRYGEAQRNP